MQYIVCLNKTGILRGSHSIPANTDLVANAVSAHGGKPEDYTLLVVSEVEHEAYIQARDEATLPPLKLVHRKRLDEYPVIGDQLDALWKIINQMRLDGMSLPQAGDDMLNAILAVKRDFPKG